MTSTTLSAGRVAKYSLHGAVQVQSHVFAFSGAANTDNDTVQIAKLPPGSTILNVVLRVSDLDSGTDVEIDVGLNPAPGGTSADADILADGLLTFTTAGLTQLTLPPTVTNGVIVAGAGIKTHEDMDSIVYLTLIDQGDATSGTIYSQVWYTNDPSLEIDIVANA